MQLTTLEEKLARLALDKGCQPGERQNAAAKLIESLYKRGIKVEDIERVTGQTTVEKVVYRDRVVEKVVEKVVERPVYYERTTTPPASAAPKQQQPKSEPYFKSQSAPSPRRPVGKSYGQRLVESFFGFMFLLAIGAVSNQCSKPTTASASAAPATTFWAADGKEHRLSDGALVNATPTPQQIVQRAQPVEVKRAQLVHHSKTHDYRDHKLDADIDKLFKK